MRFVRRAFSVALSLVGVALCGSASAADGPPPEYCKFIKEEIVLLQQGQQKFDDYQKRRKWLQPRIEKLYAKVTMATGLEHHAWSAAAMDEEWSEVCEARELGRKVVTLEQLRAATEEDRKTGRSFIEVNYIHRLDSGAETFFDNTRFGSVSCAETSVDGLQLVGCKLRAISAQTDRDLFAVAVADGIPVVVPVDAEARDRVDGLTAFEQSATDGLPTIPIGHLAGNFGFLDYEKAKAELD